MNKISSFILLTCFTLSMLGCNNSPKKDADKADKVLLKEKKIEKKEVDPALAQRIKSGHEVYTQNCAVCHQASGAGVPNMYPTIKQTDYVLDDKTWLINLLLKGSADQKVEIDGSTYSAIMPAFYTNLDDAQIADVLTYVRNSFGNGADAVKEEEVKGIRENMQ